MQIVTDISDFMRILSVKYDLAVQYEYSTMRSFFS